ncbi:virulence factor BrkB family protein [Thalassotalea sp. PS06]|uniref:virulence factor BrkB family protein n=1 Tax=Thalassotalea sp. PS06 TaxID=2594005 RepID=UPI001161D135|nr:virulence factor BrkB family protein [Thalassotalea sp. PS06]QDP02435.1 virulence factor BrkB family protein [Thalassotalea sp. PS06]
MLNINQESLVAHWHTVKQFAVHFYQRAKEDQIKINSGYLSYVTLMSLVPLVMVMFSIFSAFPLFSEIYEKIEEFTFNHFMPTASEVVREHIDGFVDNASKMSAISVTVLFALALLLISNIDASLNRIWRVQRPRRPVISFALYWMILTLGPLLIGISITATSYVVALVNSSGVDFGGFSSILLRLIPYLASLAGFMGLYLVVPNLNVRLKHAFWGGLVAALLFELGKKGFALYVTHLPSYEAIYGAMAAIPILFVWVYLSWLIVFIGAEFTVCLQEFSSQQNEPTKIND